MAKVLCVLYDDPVDGYPKSYALGGIPKIDQLSRRPDRSVSKGHRFQTGPAPRQRLRRAWASQIPRSAGTQARRHLRQGRREFHVRPRAARRGDRDLAAFLARVPHRGANRQGAQAEAGDHGGHRVGSRRPAGRHRPRHDRGRGHLLQQHQRVGARGHDDPRARAELHPVLSVGGGRRLEHRRLRRSFLRSGGDGGGDRRRGAHRVGGAPPARSLRREACTTPTGIAWAPESSRS